jgi:hypothetical protein
MAAAIRKGKARLLAKDRKELVSEFNREEQEIGQEALKILWESPHISYHENRMKFRDVFTKKEKEVFLFECIDTMQCTYKKLLSKCCVGKKYLEMQHLWFMHLTFYIERAEADDVSGLEKEDKCKLSKEWKKVIDEELKCNVTLNDEEQQIIVSSLAYIAFDLMNAKMKEKKPREH